MIHLIDLDEEYQMKEKEEVTVAVTDQGIGPKTHMEVTLDKGVLTNRLYGAYNYEGGDQAYTVTYGTRSLTEPEVDPELTVLEHTAEEEKTQANTGDIWLYVGIGVIALAAIAGAVLMIGKKKKSAGAETK